MLLGDDDLRAIERRNEVRRKYREWHRVGALSVEEATAFNEANLLAEDDVEALLGELRRERAKILIPDGTYPYPTK